MRLQLLSCLVLVALAHTAFSLDIETHLQRGNLGRRLSAGGIGVGDSSCAKVVADIIDVETSWRKKHNNQREKTCGTVAYNLMKILGGAPFAAVTSKQLDVAFSTDAPLPVFTGVCNPGLGAAKHLCTCPHTAGTATDCAAHFKVDAPNSWYIFHIMTAGDDKQASHWGVFYINSKADKAYIFQAFAQVHPLGITTTTPAKIKNAFNLMVSKHSPHAAASPADMKDLALFDANNQQYVDHIQHVRVAGPFTKAECKNLASPKNQATSRNTYCRVMSKGTYTRYVNGDCLA